MGARGLCRLPCWPKLQTGVEQRTKGCSMQLSPLQAGPGWKLLFPGPWAPGHRGPGPRARGRGPRFSSRPSGSGPRASEGLATVLARELPGPDDGRGPTLTPGQRRRVGQSGSVDPQRFRTRRARVIDSDAGSRRRLQRPARAGRPLLEWQRAQGSRGKGPGALRVARDWRVAPRVSDKLLG